MAAVCQALCVTLPHMSIVAPVLSADINKRDVYLPAGKWKNITDGTTYEGCQTIIADAPIEHIPVFERI